MPAPPRSPLRPVLGGPLLELLYNSRAILWLALALVPAFTLTAAVTELHQSEYRSHALEWSTRGDAAFADERYAEAIDAYRSALQFARDDRGLRLRLAEALLAAGRPAEARAYLADLWQEQPGNGRVNLVLARIAAATGDVDGATRYYQNAVQGAWEDAAAERRRETRLELATYLIAHDRDAQAEAELAALAAGLPPVSPLRVPTARLLVAAGAPARARALFDEALQNDPRDEAALRGASEAALALGDHAAVVRYLQRVPAASLDADDKVTLQTSQQVLALDPFRRGLSSRERALRVRRALTRAEARVRACPDAASFAALGEDLRTALRTETTTALARDPDRLDAAFTRAVAAIRATADACGSLDATDQAILLLDPAATGATP